jgi:hypothetical protein
MLHDPHMIREHSFIPARLSPSMHGYDLSETTETTPSVTLHDPRATHEPHIFISPQVSPFALDYALPEATENTPSHDSELPNFLSPQLSPFGLGYAVPEVAETTPSCELHSFISPQFLPSTQVFDNTSKDTNPNLHPTAILDDICNNTFEEFLPVEYPVFNSTSNYMPVSTPRSPAACKPLQGFTSCFIFNISN